MLVQYKNLLNKTYLLISHKLKQNLNQFFQLCQIKKIKVHNKIILTSSQMGTNSFRISVYQNIYNFVETYEDEIYELIYEQEVKVI